MLKMSKLKLLAVVTISGFCIQPLLAQADSANAATMVKVQDASNALSWSSSDVNDVVSIDNFANTNIIVSVSSNISSQGNVQLNCYGSTVFIKPGHSYTCITSKSVTWKSADSYITYGTYSVSAA